MPTVFTHAVSAVALGTPLLPAGAGLRPWILGVVCAALPDLDVLAFAFGIPYAAMLGHRGLSHSIAFALLLSTVVTALALRRARWSNIRPRIWLYLFVAVASHGILDAFTNGGLGIAFFAPFSRERYFFPVTPIEVAPIGREFFSDRGLQVLASELRWVWLPSAALIAVSLGLRAVRARRPG
ncbi:MAG TPA: metal-dependent hydrolase [Burkholderiales bacterium]|nr:metal-dependent hydrolase [Burkholderiales bacterium]